MVSACFARLGMSPEASVSVLVVTRGFVAASNACRMLTGVRVVYVRARTRSLVHLFARALRHSGILRLRQPHSPAQCPRANVHIVCGMLGSPGR